MYPITSTMNHSSHSLFQKQRKKIIIEWHFYGINFSPSLHDIKSFCILGIYTFFLWSYTNFLYKCYHRTYFAGCFIDFLFPLWSIWLTLLVDVFIDFLFPFGNEMRAFKEVMLHGKNKMLCVFPREFHYKPNIYFFALEVLIYFYSLFSIIVLSLHFYALCVIS